MFHNVSIFNVFNVIGWLQAGGLQAAELTGWLWIPPGGCGRQKNTIYIGIVI
jgi:hypothetical protein